MRALILVNGELCQPRVRSHLEHLEFLITCSLGEFSISTYDMSIDVVVATHPDKDHIGGLVDVVERYDVDFIFVVVKRFKPQSSDTAKSWRHLPAFSYKDLV